MKHLLEAELRLFEELHPRSAAAVQTRDALFGGVPMPWMMHWAGEYPVVVDHAEGARLTDIDGNEYVDFCLGDTGAMTGHSPAPVVEAASRQLARGATTMLPTEDAGVVGELLAERFGLPQWLFTVSATDANRTALRFARQITGRPKILVFSYSYHGTVDETFAVRDPRSGVTVAREGSVGPAFDVAQTTRAIEFNDIAQLEAALAPEDIAVVIAEPAMTNMGIVLPDDGYHEALRELTRKHGTLLLIDETHTFSTGYGGATARLGARARHVHDRQGGRRRRAGRRARPERRLSPTALLRRSATRTSRTSAESVARSPARALATGVNARRAHRGADRRRVRARDRDRDCRCARASLARSPSTSSTWDVQQLGCRVEYRFTKQAPRNGTESRFSFDGELERYLHLHALEPRRPDHAVSQHAAGLRRDAARRRRPCTRGSSAKRSAAL